MNHSNPPRRIGRRIGSVAAGFAIVAVLSLGTDIILHAAGIYPPWGQAMSDGLFVLATAYRLVFTVLGGYVTARLAPDRPMRYVMILSGIGLFMSIAGLVGTWGKGPEFGPKWYPIALVLTTIPCLWAGGRLAESKSAARASA